MEKTCIICKSKLQGNQKLYCCNNCKQKAHYNKIKDQPNSYHNQTIRSYRRKVEFINLKGGKCIKCGYNKNISALDFHHRDSSKKEFNLDARTLANRKKEILLEELNKCDLLCANCHREEHYKETELSNVLKILQLGSISPLAHNQ